MALSAASPRPGEQEPADHRRCVFHLRSAAHAGLEELHPLSALQHADPEAYATAIAKYDDTPQRRRLPETWIPVIDARWTEVIFLTPIHPHAIWSAWRDIAAVELPAQEFWAIGVEEIGPAVVLDRRLTRSGEPIDPREVSTLRTDEYCAEKETTARNAEWIAQLAREHRRGAWFHGTPHVLTRGPVALGSAEVVDWRDPWPGQ
ncbi:hypothetical protein [Brachybacterium sp. YJGR34]|uniref:hypothetical protein n=1 Tax=Brachybacterium sp. YJGR34 TaxID=2059911 RepID=UPI000E0B6394|nr:hypothetical protein [Brachybacterium sp. YJGR34]